MSDWQQHSCVHCGSKFRYPAGGKRTTKPATETQAYLAIVKRFLIPSPTLAIQGCPQCGLVPAESIGDKRLAAHNTCLRLGLLVLVPLLLAGLWKPFPVLLLVSGALLILWLSHLSVLLENPNKDLGANQKQAAEKMQKGMLHVDSPGDREPSAATPALPSPTWERVGWGSLSYVLPVLVGLLAAALAGSAEIVLQVCRWPRNANCQPEVVGPGDRVKIYFPDQVMSINGFWTGTASAQILNGEALGLPQNELPAFTRQATWHEAIQDKRNQREQFSSIWVEVVLPQEPGLAFQTLQMRFTVEVRYPTANRFPPQANLFYFDYDETDQSITHIKTAS
jgi:hypothetical protein